MLQSKHNYAGIYLALIFAVFIQGCGTMPQLKTFEDKQASVELSIIKAFDTLKQWRKDGLIDDDQWAKIKKDAIQASAVMDAVNTAIALGDIKEAETQLAIANNALMVLRRYLVRKEKK